MALFDLHVHTVRGSSDSSLTPQELVKSARAIGLDGVCLTEHSGGWELQELEREFADAGLRVFRGLEVVDVLAFVTEGRREDLTLEFKLAPANFGKRDDRRNLAIAVSGFANSIGGLIVWGISAEKDDDGIDCARTPAPLADSALFMSRIVEHAARAASPPVEGVMHRLVEGTGGPFALTLVPESDRGPHMAKLGENRYYQRSGDQFRMMEHYQVADMLGRRRKPALKLRLDQVGKDIAVLLTNEGRAVARAPFIELSFSRHFRASPHGIDGNGTFGLKPLGQFGHRCVFGGDAGTVIHVGQTLGVTLLESMVIRPDGSAVVNGPHLFRYRLAAEDMDMMEGEISLD